MPEKLLHDFEILNLLSKQCAKAAAEGVAAEAAKAGVRLTLNRVGSMWTWFFTADPVANYDEAARSDTAAFGRFHRAMLDAGVWLPPSQFEAMFIGTAHGVAEVEATVAAAGGAFAGWSASGAGR